MTRQERDGKQTRSGANAEMWQVQACSEYSSSPSEQHQLSQTLANSPLRLTGRLELEKEIPTHVCKHNPWPCFKGQAIIRTAPTPQLPIREAGLVSFDYFQSLSLSRARLGDGQISFSALSQS